MFDFYLAGATTLWVLHEYSGRIDAEIWLLETVLPYRGDKRFGQLSELGMPAAHRRARELDAFTLIDPFETMKRQMILPALDDGVGEQPWTRQIFRDRQLERDADADLGLGVSLSVLAYELRSDNACHDE